MVKIAAIQRTALICSDVVADDRVTRPCGRDLDTVLRIAGDNIAFSNPRASDLIICDIG